MIQPRPQYLSGPQISPAGKLALGGLLAIALTILGAILRG